MEWGGRLNRTRKDIYLMILKRHKMYVYLIRCTYSQKDLNMMKRVELCPTRYANQRAGNVIGDVVLLFSFGQQKLMRQALFC